jgi:predicted aconitase
LGFLIGSVAQTKVPVVDGVSERVTNDQLKAYCTAAAVGGSLGLSHLCGITPEARTITDAFHGSKPEETITVETEQLEQTKQKLNTLEGNDADVICLGCPHCSVQELSRIAGLLKGKK